MLGNPAKKQNQRKPTVWLSTPRNHFFCDNNFIKTLGLFDYFFYICNQLYMKYAFTH